MKAEFLNNLLLVLHRNGVIAHEHGGKPWKVRVSRRAGDTVTLDFDKRILTLSVAATIPEIK